MRVPHVLGGGSLRVRVGSPRPWGVGGGCWCCGCCGCGGGGGGVEGENWPQAISVASDLAPPIFRNQISILHYFV